MPSSSKIAHTWPGDLSANRVKVQHRQDVRTLVAGQLRRMTEPLARAFPARHRIPLPVQAGAGFTQDLARPARPGGLLHDGEMLVDDLVQFSPESALFEMSSNSANAFPRDIQRGLRLALWVPKTCATSGRCPTERGRFGQALGVGRAGLGSAGGGMIFGLWA